MQLDCLPWQSAALPNDWEFIDNKGGVHYVKRNFLGELTAHGLLAVEGAGRTTRYRLAAELCARPSTQQWPRFHWRTRQRSTRN